MTNLKITKIRKTNRLIIIQELNINNLNKQINNKKEISYKKLINILLTNQ